MTLESLRQCAETWLRDAPDNRIQSAYALRPELTGIRYYDAPLLGCASAADPLFLAFRDDPKICGAPFRTPDEWLSGAVSVISFFLPFTAEVRKSNRTCGTAISDEWLHARIEGQLCLDALAAHLAAKLEVAGFRAVIPSSDARFGVARSPARQALGEPVFSSAWSERHAAFASGLGTFGLSKHLITEKGCSGRIGSIITDAPIAPTPRPYRAYDEYCTHCGACAPRCPVRAISTETGKDILTCAAFVNGTRETYAPRYGCGKCQLAVPCETRIPQK